MLPLRLTTARVTLQEFATCRLAEDPCGGKSPRRVARDEGADEGKHGKGAEDEQQDGATATPHGLATARS